MPCETLTEIIPASSEEVFQLFHDYKRRMDWDSLLQKAYLCSEHAESQLGAKSVCIGKWYLGGLAFETEYITYVPPRIAAVKLVNNPPIFESFSATIKHQDLNRGGSRIVYTYSFVARPSWQQCGAQSVINWIFKQETSRRLRALRNWFIRRSL